MRKVFSLLLALITLVSCSFVIAAPGPGSVIQEGTVMTPYAENKGSDVYYNGATFDLSGLSESDIARELERMNRVAKINTITVYGLENCSKNIRDRLFSELGRLNMKIVVRIESYDAGSFAFTEADAASVVSAHYELLSYVSKADKRDKVAYFAINMPVDDTRVQNNAGGLNSARWINAQPVYATAIVTKLRSTLSSLGFSDAKLYLSVHYGWDNTFKVPSYATSGADGYFINCYSYPAVNQNVVPKADADRKVLIDTPHIDQCMKIYKSQYGTAPVVMEWGFHTMEFNNWTRTAQTAGLVYDRAAKEKAMKETVKYYDEVYPFVRGSLYFGYNVMKEEGNPPAMMDWGLVYAAKGKALASEAAFNGSARTTADDAVLLSAKGDAVSFADCPQLQQIALRYKADQETPIVLKTDGRVKKRLTLPSSPSFSTIGIPLVVAEGFTLTVENASDAPFVIESVILSQYLEAEFQSSNVISDEEASFSLAAASLDGEANALFFEGTRGGEKIGIRYRSDSDSKLYIELDGKRASIPLGASSSYREQTFKLPIYKNADLKVYSSSSSFVLDYLNLTGIPPVK